LNFYYNRWTATRPKATPAHAGQQDKPAAEMAIETPPAETPPPPERAVATESGQVIDDFEREPIAWQAFLDGARETRLTLTRDTRRKHDGGASLHVRYEVAAEGWATCGHVCDQPADWHRFVGVSFYLHAGKAGQEVTVIAYGGKSPDDLLHFEHRFQASRAAAEGWERVEIPWSQFRPAAWQENGNRKYDPQQAMGVALGFASSENQRHAGDLWIDDVTLMSPPPAAKVPTGGAPK
jgi:hypothetical protein